ncbi:MAG: hypothetical protein FJZ01_10600 [Candidatus Sericytochromatia bacterium]|nr:hypothetical protein [Candidatus Tanganyikabacteria bacterium]
MKLISRLAAALLFMASALASGQALAAEREWLEAPELEEDEWTRGARFFGGVRSGVGIAAGATGVAPTFGLEMGVAARRGVGFGLHLIGMSNPPAVTAFNIPKAIYGFGAAADIRFYMQTLRPLSIYPTLAFGFLAGPAEKDGTNVVLPMLNPGFGTRVAMDPGYVAFEFGFAAFQIPFVNISFGFQPDPPKASPAARPAAPGQ